MSFFDEHELNYCRNEITPKAIPTFINNCRNEIPPTKEFTLRELVSEVAKMDSENGRLQSNFVIEECAELIIEMARTYRDGKTTDLKIFEEACDVLATTFVLLYSLGVNEDEVRDTIKYKYKKALANDEEGKNGSENEDA